MKRTDENQRKIVAALRAVGASVQDLSRVGKGCPDLLVGFRGRNYLLEVKNPERRWKLTDDQVMWHRYWNGKAVVVRDSEEALAVITRQGQDHD